MKFQEIEIFFKKNIYFNNLIKLIFINCFLINWFMVNLLFGELDYFFVIYQLNNFS